MVGVLRVNPVGVVVHMAFVVANVLPGFASIEGYGSVSVDRINLVGVFGIGVQLTIILSAAVIVTHFFERSATVGGTVKTAFAVGSLEHHVNNVGIGRRNGNGHAAFVHGRNAVSKLFPGFAAVGSFVISRLRASCHSAELPSAVLFGPGINHIGVTRFKAHIGYAGVFRNVEHFFPGFATICCFVQAAVTTRAPGRTFGSHIHHVGVARVDKDFANVLRIFQPHVFPSFSIIGGFPYTVSITQRPLIIIFAGAGPNHVVVIGVHSQAPHRIGAIMVENGFKGGAVIVGAPNAARSSRHKKAAVVVRVNSKIGNAPGSKSRTDTAPFQAAENRGFQCALCRSRGFFLFGFGCSRKAAKGDKSCQQNKQEFSRKMIIHIITILNLVNDLFSG